MAEKLPIDEQKIQLGVLKQAMERTEKIVAIKAVRTIKRGLGLADAKLLVEDGADKFGWTTAAYEYIRTSLSDVLDYGFTKEQFMSLVSAAYDAHVYLYEDPLASVLHALKNLQGKGGLKYAAEQDQKFIDSI